MKRVVKLLCLLGLLGLMACQPAVESPPAQEDAGGYAAEGEHGGEVHEDKEEHGDDEGHHEGEHGDEDGEGVLMVPELGDVVLGDDGVLRVVATTSIIGDVVRQVGGEDIALTVLMGAGQDPHSYEPSAQDFTAVAEAQVVFVNGWGLEEGLLDDLENATEGGVVVPISAGIVPLENAEHGEDEHHEEGEHEDEHEGEHHEEGEEHHHHHGRFDPHVWFSVHHVEKWVANATEVLSELNPALAEQYEANAAAYLAELAELDDYVHGRFDALGDDERTLVTNHDALGYLADEYGLRIAGTIIPSASTLAEPSAQDLAGLVGEMREYGLCTVFSENTVSDTLAQTVADELTTCEDVGLVSLYTGALGEAGGEAGTYVDFMRANTEAIATALGE